MNIKQYCSWPTNFLAKFVFIYSSHVTLTRTPCVIHLYFFVIFFEVEDCSWLNSGTVVLFSFYSLLWQVEYDMLPDLCTHNCIPVMYYFHELKLATYLLWNIYNMASTSWLLVLFTSTTSMEVHTRCKSRSIVTVLIKINTVAPAIPHNLEMECILIILA